MKSNYSKFILVTLVLVVMLVVFAFPTPVYAGAKPPLGEQSAYAVFENNIGDVGTQIGSDSSRVTVDPDQYIFVCIQQDFTQALKDHDMACQWRTWGGDWETMAIIGAGSSTDWEYWVSNYTDHAEDAVSDHFVDTANGNYMWESDFPGFAGAYPPGEVTGTHETWLVAQAPTSTGRYELRWYDSEGEVGMTPTLRVDITVVIPGAPLVSTQAASSIGDNSATLNGNITDTGGSDVTERGFDWGFTDSYGSSWTETPGPYGTGLYNHGISGLDMGTLYHFRAKCYNSSGWTYGSDTEFTTTGFPSHPYLQIVQTCPAQGSSVWWEWIVVNPTDSSKTLTEVRVKEAGVDWNWTIEIQGYPTSGWADGGADGIYWSGSESIPARSATLFRVRALQANIKTANDRTMTWSATVTGESVPDRTSTVVAVDKSATGGLFYNKPGDTNEQTEAVTDLDGLYTYLYEDSSNNPLEAGTQYTFYLNVHEWLGGGSMDGTLEITIPKEFTSVALVDTTDFPTAALSGGGASDWTITDSSASVVKNTVEHLSFNATTPTGYGVNTNWEFDTRFTGTGGKNATGLDYITEANVLVQVTWESYNDAAHQNVWGGVGTEYDSTYDMVYMYGNGFELSQLYHIGFYDPSASPNKVATDSSNATATGDLSAQYLLTTDPAAEAGTWHAVVYKDPNTPPTDYTADDPNSVVEDDFEVTPEAIPEFLTVISAIAVAALCFGAYYWMRKRRLAYAKA